METLRLRTGLATAGILLALVWVFPNLVNMDNVKWWPSKAKINYGLDIQGGLNLVMGADVDGVVSESTTRLMATLKDEFAKANLKVTGIKATAPTKGEISIEL